MSFDWRPYHHYYHHHHSVVGNLQIAPNVWSPQTHNKRHVLALLPPSYHQSDKRYPVIYMHDGQNLFDHVTSFAGDWQVDETMQKLSQEGLEAIIVGLNNTGEDRLKEYTPFVSQRLGGGHGKQYLDFLIDTVKPTIDRDFRTCPTPEHTGIVGSSLGGLISLYAFFARSDVFGLAGVMSPSLWFANRAIVDYVDNAPFPGGKIYLDAGTREYNDFDYKPVKRSRDYYAGVRGLYRMLYAKGYHPHRTILYVEEKWARHREAAWARRLPHAFRFLLG
jgi:predicted alpha/beta superfamily hydrolase